MARKTVLVCDSCGTRSRRGPGRRVAGHVFRRAARLEGRRSLRRMRRQDAGPRRPPAAAGGRRRSRPRKASTERETRPERPSGHVLRPLYDGKVGLALLAGPANAGKVALLLERYLARLDDEPCPDRAEPVGRRPGRARPARRAAAASSAGRSAPSTTCSRRLAAGDPERRPVLSDAQRSLVVRRALGDVSLNGLEQSARDERLRRVAPHGARRARVRAARPRGSERRARRALRRLPTRSSTGSAAGIATSNAAARSSGSQNELDAWHGQPVFAYGFEDLTGAEWALLEALAGRTEVYGLAPIRAWTRRLRVARPDGDRSRGARGGKPRGAARRARPTTRIPRSRISSARSSTSRRRRRPSSDAAVRFFEGAGVRGTLELVGDELAAPHPRRDAARADRAGCAVARDVARAARDGARVARRAVCDRVAAAARLDAARQRAAAAPSLRLGRRRPARAVRVPALAVLRPRALVGRLRRGAPARSRNPHAGASRGGGCEAARGADSPARRAAGGRRLRPRACARSSARWSARPTGARRRRRGRRRALDLRSYGSVLELLDELDAFAALDGELRPEEVLGALERADVRPPAPAKPDGSRSSICCARARAGSKSCSSSASRRDPCRAASASRRSSTTTRAASSAAGSSAPIR